MKKTKLLACALCAMSLTAAAAGAANTVTAVPTRETGQTVYLNVTNRFDEDCYTRVYPTAYNIGGNNYFKLRDLGALFGFSVDWNDFLKTVELGERRMLNSDFSLQDTAKDTAQASESEAHCRVIWDGKVKGTYILKSYNIDGNNYVKLRDLAELMQKEVRYDAKSQRVELYSALGFGDYDSYYAAWLKVNGNAANNNTAVANVSTGTTAQNTNTTNNNAAAANTSTSTTSQSIATANTNTTAQRELMPISDELYDKLVQASLKYVNEERAKVGVAPLEHNPLLTRSAKWWAEQMASTGDFRHTTQNDLVTMDREYGIYAYGAKAAENIAKTPIDPSDITMDYADRLAKGTVKQYANSPAHYKIMTDAEYNSVEFIGIGFAVAKTERGLELYSVQQYGDDEVSRGIAPFWSKFPLGTIGVKVKIMNGKTVYYDPIVSTSSFAQENCYGTGEITEYVFD